VSTRAPRIVAALTLLHLGSLAADARPCPPIVFGDSHESLDELAIATVGGLLLEGGRYESGGFFIESDGRFHASKPVTQRSGNSVDYCVVVPRDARLAGLYHTHVANPALSLRDRNNAERAGVPSYIGTIREGSLVVYDARFDRVTRLQGAAAAAHDRRPPAATARREPLLEQLAALGRSASAIVERVVTALGLRSTQDTR
jgi:hypothetical protein